MRHCGLAVGQHPGVSSEAVATAAREHAQTDEAAPSSRNGTDPSNPAAPFAAGARHVAAVRPTEIVALQRLAGNAAVSRMVARRHAASRASVQREGPGDVKAVKAGTGTDAWSDVKAMGDDPMALIRSTPSLFSATDTIKPDDDYKGDPKVFQPEFIAVVFMDYIVIVHRSFGPMEVRDQGDPPSTSPKNVVVITEPATHSLWTLQVNDASGQIRAHRERGLAMKAMGDAPKGMSSMYSFVPGEYLGADNAADIRRKIDAGKNAKPGKPGQNPDWAKSQMTKLKQRRGKGKGAPPGGPAGVEGGTGLC